MDRRKFMGSAAVLAAGTVAGMKSRVKTHGPVEMKLVIWTPFTVPCMLSGDPDRDRFRVRMMPENMPHIHAEIQLSMVREVMEGRGRDVNLRTWNERGEVNEQISMFVSDGHLNFVPPGGKEETPPIRLRLEDVRRVL